jgi:Protein of unknown function (DUF1465)
MLASRLIDGLYMETMVLADEARSYFDEMGRVARDSLAPLDRVVFSCESLKVTTRLMHVIAWLLTQKVMTSHSPKFRTMPGRWWRRALIFSVASNGSTRIWNMPALRPAPRDR